MTHLANDAFASSAPGPARPQPYRPARLSFRLAPAGLPLLAAVLSCGITLVSFSAVDACAANTHATTTAYVASSV